MALVLNVESVKKRFGSVVALDDVSLQVYGGEVHAVLGENGAGKSTLMGVLAGFVSPDSGRGTIEGEPLLLGDPVAIRSQGVEMVHQHFMLVPAFRVEENLALAGLKAGDRSRNLKALSESAEKTARSLGWELDLSARTESLPVGVQQRVEILKALSARAKVLILDEPTAVLSPDEVEDLMGLLRRLKDSGAAIVLIAHKLSETVGIADRVTVLRQGKVVASCKMAETDASQLADWMTGSFQEASRRAGPTAQTGPAKLEVSDVWVKGSRNEDAVKGVSFAVHAGQVFGIGGVDGNGQAELAEALAGIRMPATGSISASGTVGYIPQDRQTEGLALSLSVQDNLFVGALDDKSLVFGPFVSGRRVREWAQKLVAKFAVKTPGVDFSVSGLSGGNQQKLVVARVLSQGPEILVAVNPTRGLDIRATAFVHGQILRAAENGAAVVLVTTDRDELETLSDTVVYMSRGVFSDHLLGSIP